MAVELRRRGLGVALAVLASSAVLVACDSDPDPPGPTPTGSAAGLLEAGDLPSVESSKPYDSNGTADTGCGPLSGLESNLDATEPESYGTEFRLGDHTRVISSLLGVYVTEGTVEYTLTRVDAAVDECVQDSAAESFDRLDGLPDRAVGFRSVISSSDGPVTTERAYAIVSDQRVAVVTVEHTGDGSAPTSVADLLPTAVDRAGEVE